MRRLHAVGRRLPACTPPLPLKNQLLQEQNHFNIGVGIYLVPPMAGEALAKWPAMPDAGKCQHLLHVCCFMASLVIVSKTAEKVNARTGGAAMGTAVGLQSSLALLAVHRELPSGKRRS